MGCSNNLLGILNIITFLLSIPILGGGIWLSSHASTDCEHFLQKPVIALGIFLMVVAVAGIIGACCRVNWLLWLYLLVMFILIIVLTVFTVFAFVVTNKGAGEVVSNRGYKEYKLGDYSNWLQKRVENEKNWRRIKSCLIDGKVCQSLEDDKITPSTQFFAKNLSPIQSGCCKPPDICNFEYVSPTQWTKTTTANTTNTDCNTWSNDQTALCYNCQSCKAGVLQNLKGHWKKVAVINIVFLVFIIIVYSIGCCAFRSNRWDNSWKPYAGR
ncbi:hypothetical protein RND81_06G172900 [Saponaria officinalis]|uniref:Tetraspanin-8 n=1 Tax=Saponaria officinalis TaxID=3572 RepID=A0AAW1KC27_SAPOF